MRLQHFNYILAVSEVFLVIVASERITRINKQWSQRTRLFLSGLTILNTYCCFASGLSPRQRLAQVRSVNDLNALCLKFPAVRLRHPDEIVKTYMRVAISETKPTHLVTLVPATGWRPGPRCASDFDRLQDLATRWLWRMSSHALGQRRRKRLDQRRWFPFMAFPEDRDDNGNPVPPHYHIMVRLTPKQATKFEVKGAVEWQKVLGLGTSPVDLYDLRAITNGDTTKVAYYCTKQASEVWVLDRIIDPTRIARR